jgi:hypothetical protein
MGQVEKWGISIFEKTDKRLKRKEITFLRAYFIPRLKEAELTEYGGWSCFALRATQDGALYPVTT